LPRDTRPPPRAGYVVGVADPRRPLSVSRLAPGAVRRRGRLPGRPRPVVTRPGTVPGHVSSRWRALTLTPAQLLPLVLAEVGALWLIVVTGAAVRLTDSGLGCRHWPGCEAGHPLPAKGGHGFTEVGHRPFGAPTVAIT